MDEAGLSHGSISPAHRLEVLLGGIIYERGRVGVEGGADWSCALGRYSVSPWMLSTWIR